MREILTGHGVSHTELTVEQIAEARSRHLQSSMDQLLFIHTFNWVRTVASQLAVAPMDLELICVEFTRHSPVMYAAMVEALASIRAEGIRL